MLEEMLEITFFFHFFSQTLITCYLPLLKRKAATVIYIYIYIHIYIYIYIIVVALRLSKRK